MEVYYQHQPVSPDFSGHYPNEAEVFWGLAAGIGRAALTIARKILWPVAKKIAREVIVQATPELVEIVIRKSLQNHRKSRQCKKL